MTVEILAAAPEDADTVANLMNLYLHEFSDIDPLATGEIGHDGRFTYYYLDQYWKEPGRYPFLIHADGRLAGFALVAEQGVDGAGKPVHAIAEFFVLRPHRRREVGERAARALFERFPGGWWVAQHPANTPAQAFWRKVIGRYTGGTYDE